MGQAQQTVGKNGIHLLVQAHHAALVRDWPAQADWFNTEAGEVGVLLDAFQAKRDQWQTSGSFTPSGLAKQLSDAGKVTRAELLTWKKRTADVLTKRIEDKLAAARPPTRKGEIDARRAQLLAEYRAELRKLDPLERQALVRRVAAEGSDPDLLDAVASAPRSFPLVPAEVLATAQREASTAADPEITEWTRLRDAYQAVFAVASEDLRGTLAQHGIALDEPAKA